MRVREDPRVTAARRRLKEIKAIVPVVSPKGGVGKTLISSMLALILAERGLRVGLLDLDITNPTAHLVLGAGTQILPREERGVVPPIIHGVKFMSPAYYSRDAPLVLRGAGIADAIRELLAITVWGALDVLLLDMPPGLSDEVLEVMLLSESPKPLLVSTQSLLSLHSIARISKMLGDSGISVLGLIENMALTPHSPFKDRYEELGLSLLAVLPFEPGVEEAVGRPGDLLGSGIASKLRELVAPRIAGLA